MSDSNEIVWANPPPSRRMRQSGRADFVDALKKNPGRWAVYRSQQQTTAGVYALKQSFPGLEVTSRTNGDKTFDLYARWVGEPDD